MRKTTGDRLDSVEPSTQAGSVLLQRKRAEKLTHSLRHTDIEKETELQSRERNMKQPSQRKKERRKKNNEMTGRGGYRKVHVTTGQEIPNEGASKALVH